MFAPCMASCLENFFSQMPVSCLLQFQPAMIILKADKITFIQNYDEAQI